jgi:hypothetical protein
MADWVRQRCWLMHAMLSQQLPVVGSAASTQHLGLTSLTKRVLLGGLLALALIFQYSSFAG